ncbi:hypothetical protein LTR17_027008 [Elasticomyces elasticus]|nr:hypothetical protein LTR17_027008 [Elasticomyces elasticus]
MAAPHLTPVAADELIYERQQLPKRRSNYGEHLNQSSIGWLKKTPADTSLDEMRTSFEADGYLFIKGLVAREDVLNVRKRSFEHLRSTGILKAGTEPEAGIFEATQDPVVNNGVCGRDLPEDLEGQKLLKSAHTLPVYLDFSEHSDFRDFIRRLMGWDKDVILKRTLLRHTVPNGLSTGCHYDRICLRAGEDFLIAWVPIGDCAADEGGLMYLEGSTDIGVAMGEEYMERCEYLTPEERIDRLNQNMARNGQLSHNVVELDANTKVKSSSSKRRQWLAADYEAGDVVFHNPYIIHGAVKDENPLGRVRLGTDLEYYREGSRVDERWKRDVLRLYGRL